MVDLENETRMCLAPNCWLWQPINADVASSDTKRRKRKYTVTVKMTKLPPKETNCVQWYIHFHLVSINWVRQLTNTSHLNQRHLTVVSKKLEDRTHSCVCVNQESRRNCKPKRALETWSKNGGGGHTLNFTTVPNWENRVIRTLSSALASETNRQTHKQTNKPTNKNKNKNNKETETKTKTREERERGRAGGGGENKHTDVK